MKVTRAGKRVLRTDISQTKTVLVSVACVTCADKCDTWGRADCEDSGDGTVGRTGSGESLNGPHPAAISSEG